MGFEDDPIGSLPTVDDIISQLRLSFLSSEFQQAASLFKKREELIKQKHLKLKTKVEEEKDVIFSENLKLKNELKEKETEIEAMRKVIAEYETKIRVYEKQSDDKVLSSENKKQKSCSNESIKPSLLREKDSKKKTEAKPLEIINIDDDDDDDCDDQGKQVPNETKREYDGDDDDDDRKTISSIKRRRLEREIKKGQGTKETKSARCDESAKILPHLGKTALDSPEPDSGLDDEKVDKLYMLSIRKVKQRI